MSILTAPDGEKWLAGEREKTRDLFLREEYGVRPDVCQKPLSYKTVAEKRENGVVIRRVEMTFGNLPMTFFAYLPEKGKAPFRTFVMPLHPLAERDREKNVDKDLFADYRSVANYCPIDDIVARRYAVLLISCKTVAADEKGGECTGILKETGTARTADSWGVLSAWAYACGKAADYAEQCDELDEKHLAVIGHSRGGKTALLTGALDERFCLVISNNSGNSGAALSRGNTGETVADITRTFPYWFCENYKKYADNENALPFDQHLLLALQAPRHCYVASASEDGWADPDGELLSARLASVYWNVYGFEGLIAPQKIENDVSYAKGRLAYHRRTGKHALTSADWRMYMDYFDTID